MHEGYVQIVSQKCRVCLHGPYNPRIDQVTDRYTGEIVEEATWICSNCGAKFAAGIVRVIKQADEKKA